MPEPDTKPPAQVTFHDMPESSDTAPPPVATTTRGADHARADFQCADQDQQIQALKELMKKKGYTNVLTKPLEQFTEHECEAFYVHLVKMADVVAETKSALPELPFT